MKIDLKASHTKKYTVGLFIAGLALALAGGANQALAMQKCSPVGGCMTGDRCNKNGLWIADKSCSIAVPGASPILPADKKAQSQGNGVVQAEIFDRWGKMKTKKDCATGGGVWVGEDGKGSCTERRK